MTTATAAKHARLLIDGRWTAGVESVPVFDKFSGAPIGQAERASREQVAAAIAAAKRSFERVTLEPYERYIMRAMNVSKRLHVGVVHINEPSSSRVDLMPFGGVKDSGMGREGRDTRCRK